jgi:hypothetical protein
MIYAATMHVPCRAIGVRYMHENFSFENDTIEHDDEQFAHLGQVKLIFVRHAGF